MIALVISDLQLDDNYRNAYRWTFLKTIPALIRQHKPKYLIVLGDLTEEKDRHSAALVNFIVNWLADCAQLCQVIVLRGNHDYVDINDTFFEFVGRIHGIKFISLPTSSVLTPLGRCLFLPHTRNYKRDWKGLSDDNFDFIFTHNTFEGAKGIAARPLDGIPVDALPPATYTISGDVHVPQKSNGVIYVGSPYRVNFGDDYAPRLLGVGNNRIVSLPTSGPRKYLIELTRLELNDMPDIKRGDILKVRAKLLLSEVERWPAFIKRVKVWAHDGGYVIDSLQLQVEQKARKRVKVHADEEKDDEQIVREFGKYRDVNERTIATGLFIMEKGEKDAG